MRGGESEDPQMLAPSLAEPLNEQKARRVDGQRKLYQCESSRPHLAHNSRSRETRVHEPRDLTAAGS